MVVKCIAYYNMVIVAEPGLLQLIFFIVNGIEVSQVIQTGRYIFYYRITVRTDKYIAQQQLLVG